jgi:hypothetical protein
MAIRDRMHPGTVEIQDGMNDVVSAMQIIRKAPTNVTARVQSGAVVEAACAWIVENGAGTYNFDVLLPAGALITNILVHNHVLWAAATSASLEVGDFTNAATPVAIDADGFFTAVDLKATDLLALESVSLLGGGQGGVAGAYNAGTNTHWTNLYKATERILRFSTVSVGAGTAGRTFCAVTFVAPGETLVTVTQ